MVILFLLSYATYRSATGRGGRHGRTEHDAGGAVPLLWCSGGTRGGVGRDPEPRPQGGRCRGCRLQRQHRRPSGAEEAVHTARFHLQVQVVECPEASEALDQAMYAYWRFRPGSEVMDRGGRGVGGRLRTSRAGRCCGCACCIPCLGSHSTGSSPAERRMVAAKSGSASMRSMSSATKACCAGWG